MKSTKRYFFCKIGFLSMAMICTMLFSFCGKENTIYSYAYTKTTGIVKPESAKVRSEANTSSESLAGVKQSETVTIIDETKDSAGNIWYKVEVDNTTGYIRADLVTKGKANDAADSTSNNTEKPEITETQADVAPSSVSSGTITETSINVRKGPSATDAVVTSAKKGTVVSITGEAKGADGKTWYQVSFLNNGKDVIGFIRSDLLKTSSESTEEESEEGSAEIPEGENEGVQEEGNPPQEGEAPENHTEVSNVVGSRIIPEGTDISQMGIDESVLLGWQSGNYYLLYTTGNDGSDAWYLYDVSGDSYQQIENLVPNDSEEETDSKGSILADKHNIIIIVLAILLILMLILCTVMFLKIRLYKGYGDDDDDDEEEDDDDEEDDEDEEESTRVKHSRWKSRNFLKSEEEEEEDEEEEEEEEEVPIKRSSKKAPIKKMPQSNKPQVQQKTEAPIAKAVETTPKFQMDLDDDDDEFEFGFLNMDGKGDL